MTDPTPMTEAQAADYLTHVYACGCQVLWYIPHPAGGPSAMRCNAHVAEDGPCETDVRPARLEEALKAMGPPYAGMLATLKASPGSVTE